MTQEDERILTQLLEEISGHLKPLLCPSCLEQVNAARWDTFDGICIGCSMVIRELP